MSIDWTKPLVVAGTDRAATVVRYLKWSYLVSADWGGDGDIFSLWLAVDSTFVTNAPPTPDTRALVRSCNEALGNVAPPTPKIGPEHIEALAEAIADYGWPHRDDVLKVARLAEIRAYLESL